MYHFQEIMILKQQNVKRVTDALVSVKFIFKNSNMLLIEHSLLNSPIIIPHYGFHFRSTDLSLTNPIHKIPGQLVKQTWNKTLLW